MKGAGCDTLQQHRLQGPRRALRGHGVHRRAAGADSRRRLGGSSSRRKAIDEGMITLRMSGLQQGDGRRHDDRRSRARNGEVERRMATARMATLPELLKTMVEKAAVRPAHHHRLAAAGPRPRQPAAARRCRRSAPADTKQLAYSVLTDAQKKRFEEDARARLLVRHPRPRALPLQRLHPARRGRRRVYRVIPEQIRALRRARPAAGARRRSPSGRAASCSSPARPARGKSTTLAAMIDKINTERHEHILTIEDPIEYLHQHKSCLVNQREVHSDTQQLQERAARRAARGPRHRPDRRDARPRDDRGGADDRRDRPPAFGTLHTNSAAQTINRIIDVFPAHQQAQIRTQLSLVLEGDRLSGAAAEGRRQGPRRRRSRSWCRRRRSGT